MAVAALSNIYVVIKSIIDIGVSHRRIRMEISLNKLYYYVIYKLYSKLQKQIRFE